MQVSELRANDPAAWAMHSSSDAKRIAAQSAALPHGMELMRCMVKGVIDRSVP
jgi:hypothetical protein